MSRPQATPFGFTIQPCETGWLWRIYGRDGRVSAAGRAGTRAIAAALVIRELTGSSNQGASPAAMA